MSNHINRSKVFEAAQALVKQGRTPTQDNVRLYLGRGSRGTIHKYLKEWKQGCFEQGGQSKELDEKAGLAWLAEKRGLEQALENQVQLNRTLSHDLLQTERELAKLREQTIGQAKQLEELAQAQQTLNATYQQIKAVYEASCLERETAIDKVIEDKNRLIEKLREELRALHERNLKQMQEWSFQKEDRLLQEKVKSLNYQDQLKNLKEELKKQGSELLDARQVIAALKREKTQLAQSQIAIEGSSGLQLSREEML